MGTAPLFFTSSYFSSLFFSFLFYFFILFSLLYIYCYGSSYIYTLLYLSFFILSFGVFSIWYSYSLLFRLGAESDICFYFLFIIYYLLFYYLLFTILLFTFLCLHKRLCVKKEIFFLLTSGWNHVSGNCVAYRIRD